MSIDRRITCRSRQVLVLTVWNVKMGFGVTVFLGQSEINYIDLISTLSNSHQEVVRLYITVDEGFSVDVFNAGDELIRQEQDSLQREFAVAKIEQVLQAGAEKIKYHSIVITLCPEPANERNSDSSSERLVYTGLIFKLRMLGLDTLQFDGNLFSRNDVGSCKVFSSFLDPIMYTLTKINIAKATATNLTANTVLVADTKILSKRRLASKVCIPYTVDCD